MVDDTCFCADFDCDELVNWRARLGFAACEQVGAWATHGVFEEV